MCKITAAYPENAVVVHVHGTQADLNKIYAVAKKSDIVRTTSLAPSPQRPGFYRLRLRLDYSDVARAEQFVRGLADGAGAPIK
jgi:hypothetical protein